MDWEITVDQDFPDARIMTGDQVVLNDETVPGNVHFIRLVSVGEVQFRRVRFDVREGYTILSPVIPIPGERADLTYPSELVHIIGRVIVVKREYR